MHGPAIPLAPWAERELAGLSHQADSPALGTLSATGLMAERALDRIAAAGHGAEARVYLSSWAGA